MSKAFGLDFGTTNSALALARADRAVELARFGAASTFRSILYFEEDETSKSGNLRVVAGPDAIQAETDELSTLLEPLMPEEWLKGFTLYQSKVQKYLF